MVNDAEKKMVIPTPVMEIRNGKRVVYDVSTGAMMLKPLSDAAVGWDHLPELQQLAAAVGVLTVDGVPLSPNDM